MFRAYTFNHLVGDGRRIVIKYQQQEKTRAYPTGERFAIIGIMNEEQVIRIDNSPHHGITKTHIHYLKTGQVIFKELSQELAYQYVKEYLRGQYD